MKVLFTERFARQYADLSPNRKAKVDKQIKFLLSDLGHPSLRAKKYDPSRDIWQARVDRSYRLYFRIKGDTYELLSVIPHPK